MKSKGLGDTVEKLIKKVAPKFKTKCGGCEKRKKLLNKVFPYK